MTGNVDIGAWEASPLVTLSDVPIFRTARFHVFFSFFPKSTASVVFVASYRDIIGNIMYYNILRTYERHDLRISFKKKQKKTRVLFLRRQPRRTAARIV